MNNEKIGSFIANLRKSKNMTQKELASKLNISDKAVSKWERGISLPDISILPKLSEILDIEISELLNGEAKAPQQSDADNLILDTIKYADISGEFKANKIRLIAAFLLSAAFIIGITVCLICDIAISGKLTWSLISVSSIVYCWLITVPVIYCKRSGTLFSIASVTVFTIPFLAILDKLIKQTDMILPLGSRVALVSIVYIWLIYFLSVKLKKCKLIALAIIFFLAIPFQIILKFIIKSYIGGGAFDKWDALAFSIIIVVSVTLLLFDLLLRSLKTNKNC